MLLGFSNYSTFCSSRQFWNKSILHWSSPVSNRHICKWLFFLLWQERGEKDRSLREERKQEVKHVLMSEWEPHTSLLVKFRLSGLQTVGSRELVGRREPRFLPLAAVTGSSSSWKHPAAYLNLSLEQNNSSFKVLELLQLNLRICPLNPGCFLSTLKEGRIRRLWSYSMRAICPGTQSKGLGFGEKSLQVILQEAYQADIKNIQVQSSSIFIC